MKRPLFITSLCMLFWGWQTGLLPVALVMIPIVESHLLIRHRWAFSEKDFNRIGDISTLILFAFMVYNIFNAPSQLIHTTLKWLPVIVLPIVISQLYSVSGKIDIRAVMIFARKNKLRRLREIKDIDITWAYNITCIISAGTGNQRTHLFYLALFLISLYAIFKQRSMRYGNGIWFILFCIAAIVGWYGHQGLYRLQGIVTEMTIDYLLNKGVDPFKSHTSIGEIGEMKLSDRIVLRVKSSDRQTLLLNESVYTAWRGTSWYATLSGFSGIDSPPETGGNWELTDKKIHKTDKNRLTIYTAVKGRKKVLPLPGGTYRLENLNVGTLETNSLGVVRASEGDGFSAFHARFGDLSWARKPGPSDYDIPETEIRQITAFLSEVDSYYNGRYKTGSVQEKMRMLKKYFMLHFQYSLVQENRAGESKNHITRFLADHRKGHCELFATATVLCLRASGIPTRYSTGFLMHEYNPMEDLYLIRERDAHAWSQVWIDGKWQNYDTTPPDWTFSEKSHRFFGMIDLLSFLKFRFSKWRAGLTGDDIRKISIWSLLPLTLFLLYRLRPGDRIRRIRKEKETTVKATKLPSVGLYLLEAHLSKAGFKRYPYETFGNWVQRIEKSGVPDIQIDTLQELLKLHYRAQYSREPISDLQTKFLNDKVKALISRDSTSI